MLVRCRLGVADHLAVDRALDGLAPSLGLPAVESRPAPPQDAVRSAGERSLSHGKTVSLFPGLRLCQGANDLGLNLLAGVGLHRAVAQIGRDGHHATARAKAVEQAPVAADVGLSDLARPDRAFPQGDPGTADEALILRQLVAAERGRDLGPCGTGAARARSSGDSGARETGAGSWRWSARSTSPAGSLAVSGREL